MMQGLIYLALAVLNWIAFAGSTNGNHTIARWINFIMAVVLAVIALGYMYGV